MSILVILILMSRASREVALNLVFLLDDQALGHAEHVVLLRVVGDNGEAQLDGAGAAGHGHVVHRGVGVDKGEHAVHGVAPHGLVVAGLGAAEDDGGAEGHADHVGHAAQVAAQGHAADVEAQLHALLDALVDDAAHQGDKDTLGLVLLHQLHALLSGGGGADDHSHAGDVPGDQGHAQLTDLGVGEVAHDRLLIGAAAVRRPTSSAR